MMPLPLCTRATMVLFIVLTSQVLVAAMAATPATKVACSSWALQATLERPWQQLVSRGLPAALFSRATGGPARALDG